MGADVEAGLHAKFDDNAACAETGTVLAMMPHGKSATMATQRCTASLPADAASDPTFNRFTASGRGDATP